MVIRNSLRHRTLGDAPNDFTILPAAEVNIYVSYIPSAGASDLCQVGFGYRYQPSREKSDIKSCVVICTWENQSLRGKSWAVHLYRLPYLRSVQSSHPLNLTSAVVLNHMSTTYIVSFRILNVFNHVSPDSSCYLRSPGRKGGGIMS